VQHRIELRHEAQHYQLHGLVTLLQQAEVQAQAQVAAPDLKSPTPTFLSSRPSTKGLFYINDPLLKWSTIFPNTGKEWQAVALQFQEGKMDEVSFVSANIVPDVESPEQELIETSKLSIEKNEKSPNYGHAHATVSIGRDSADVDLWFEPTPNSPYPNLVVKISRDGQQPLLRILDFFRLMPE